MIVGALLVLLVLLFVARALAGSWINPSVVFIAVWLVYVIGFYGASDILRQGNSALIFIVLCCIGACAASSLGGVFASPNQSTMGIKFNRGALLFVAFSALAGLAAGLLSYAANGIPFSSLFSIEALLISAGEITEARYAQAIQTSTVSTLLLAVCSAGVAVAPIVSSSLNSRARIIFAVAPVLGALSYAILTTARAHFVMSVALALGSQLAVMVMRREELRPRAVLGLAVIVGGGAAAFIGIALLRAPEITSAVLFEKLTVYALGSISALSAWLDAGGAGHGVLLGRSTFYGFYKLITLSPSGSSAYSDFTDVGIGNYTNVYTVFRHMIEDFGSAGAILFVTVLLLFGSCLFNQLRRAPRATYLWLYTWLVAWILYGATGSMFLFTNISIACALSGIVLVASAHQVSLERPPVAQHQPPDRV